MPSSQTDFRPIIGSFYATLMHILERKQTGAGNKCKTKPLKTNLKSEFISWSACFTLLLVYSLCTTILLLANDIESNPGPRSNQCLCGNEGFTAYRQEQYDRFQEMLHHIINLHHKMDFLWQNATQLHVKLTQKIENQDLKYESLEIKQRQNNIKFIGLIEDEVDGIPSTDKVTKLLNKYSRDPCWKASDIAFAYRQGEWSLKNEKSPRPLIVSFRLAEDKSFILRDRELRRRLRDKEGIKLASDLTEKQQQEIDFYRNKGYIAYFKQGKLFVEDEFGCDPRQYNYEPNQNQVPNSEEEKMSNLEQSSHNLHNFAKTSIRNMKEQNQATSQLRDNGKPNDFLSGNLHDLSQKRSGINVSAYGPEPFKFGQKTNIHFGSNLHRDSAQQQDWTGNRQYPNVEATDYDFNDHTQHRSHHMENENKTKFPYNPPSSSQQVQYQYPNPQSYNPWSHTRDFCYDKGYPNILETNRFQESSDQNSFNVSHLTIYPFQNELVDASPISNVPSNYSEDNESTYSSVSKSPPKPTILNHKLNEIISNESRDTDKDTKKVNSSDNRNVNQRVNQTSNQPNQTNKHFLDTATKSTTVQNFSTETIKPTGHNSNIENQINYPTTNAQKPKLQITEIRHLDIAPLRQFEQNEKEKKSIASKTEENHEEFQDCNDQVFANLEADQENESMTDKFIADLDETAITGAASSNIRIEKTKMDKNKNTDSISPGPPDGSSSPIATNLIHDKNLEKTPLTNVSEENNADKQKSNVDKNDASKPTANTSVTNINNQKSDNINPMESTENTENSLPVADGGLSSAALLVNQPSSSISMPDSGVTDIENQQTGNIKESTESKENLLPVAAGGVGARPKTSPAALSVEQSSLNSDTSIVENRQAGNINLKESTESKNNLLPVAADDVGARPKTSSVALPVVQSSNSNKPSSEEASSRQYTHQKSSTQQSDVEQLIVQPKSADKNKIQINSKGPGNRRNSLPNETTQNLALKRQATAKHTNVNNKQKPKSEVKATHNPSFMQPTLTQVLRPRKNSVK